MNIRPSQQLDHSRGGGGAPSWKEHDNAVLRFPAEEINSRLHRVAGRSLPASAQK
jgi:hypothetical protein